MQAAASEKTDAHSAFSSYIFHYITFFCIWQVAPVTFLQNPQVDFCSLSVKTAKFGKTKKIQNACIDKTRKNGILKLCDI